MTKQVGLTKDVGFQFGLRKTFPYPAKDTWDFMFSKEGIAVWLGETEEALEVEKDYQTKDGIEGFVRVFKPYSHIRMKWKRKDWGNMSTVQVRVMGDLEKSIISFHQEKLLSLTQREEMSEYWNSKMNKISDLLNGPEL